MIKNNNIEFLIFDMGNVIIDIDISLTLNELKKDLRDHEFLLADDFMKSELHADFEKGSIDELAFRNGVRTAFKRELDRPGLEHPSAYHPQGKSGTSEKIKETIQIISPQQYQLHSLQGGGRNI
jgi:hypothetical protein